MEEITTYEPAPRKARVEIIPLIDVIFFLLATFVLFTLSLDKIGALDVPLPKGGPPGREESTVFLQAAGHGTFFWKEGPDASSELITRGEIAPRLADYVRRVPRPRVLVRGDGRASFGAAVMILDEVRRAGIKEASIETLVSKEGS